MPEPSGVLLVDKPEGPTSHDIVAAARRALAVRRIGHTGTLDPFASGLLLLCVGSATRLAEYLTRLPKSYVGEVRLGVRTTTDDPTGDVIATSDAWRDVTPAAVEQALDRLRGEIEQRPPSYSAKKLEGTPAYRRARRGETVALAPARVTIQRIALLEWRPPSFVMEVDCSSGTYIRSLARDVGDALGCGAHLATLRRTRVGEHHVDSAVRVDDLGDAQARARGWLEPAEAVAHLPRLRVSDEEAAELAEGRVLATYDAALPEGAPIAAIGASGLVAVVELDAGRVRPRKVFLRD